MAKRQKSGRYYAQHVVEPRELGSWAEDHTKEHFNEARGWMVFDRKFIGALGVEMPIALCISQKQAFKICDALNCTRVA
jgi:hypothetical protein